MRAGAMESIAGLSVTMLVLATLVMAIGAALRRHPIVALGELVVQQWHGGEMPIGGVV